MQRKEKGSSSTIKRTYNKPTLCKMVEIDYCGNNQNDLKDERIFTIYNSTFCTVGDGTWLHDIKTENK